MKELHLPKIRTLDLRTRSLGTSVHKGMLARARALERILDHVIPTLWDHPNHETKALEKKARAERFIERHTK